MSKVFSDMTADRAPVGDTDIAIVGMAAHLPGAGRYSDLLGQSGRGG